MSEHNEQVLNSEMEFSVEVRDELAGHGIAIDTLRNFLREKGDMTILAAIGGILSRAQNVSEGDAIAGEASGDAVLAEQEAAKAAREAQPEAPQPQEAAPEVAQTQEEGPKAESEASPAPQATEAEAPTEQAVDAES